MAQKGSGQTGSANQGTSGAATAAGQQGSARSFLVGLATDPARLGAFIKDPDSELERAGVSEADRAILKSGNPAAIYGLIGGQSAAAAQPQIPPVIILVIDAEAAKEGGEPQLTLRPGAIGGYTGYPAIIYSVAPGTGTTPPSVIQPPMVVMLAVIAEGQAQTAAGSAPTFPTIIPPPMVIIFGGPQGPTPSPIQFPPQILPQMIFPQIQPQLVQPQIHPQMVFPQVQPQLVVQPQIHPQMVFPQVHPQIVVQPQIHPQMVFPQVHPQIVVQPQIHPQMVFPQIHPQIVVQPQIHPQLVFPQIFPQIFTPR
ncbi:MAG TPA: hypothetical protein VN231_08390 [Allosphingosinicella sp.]|nr:hypothetical protein [Allosphingosinicella sp.]